MNSENTNLDFTDPTNALSPEANTGINTESADVLAARLSEKIAGGESLSAEDKLQLGDVLKTLRKHQSYIPSDSPEALELNGKIALLNRILNEETIH
jgi:hypothetical protein